MGIEFDRLKQQNDIADVVGRYVNLKRQGSELVGTCPFHDDNHASLQVNPRKQIFKCFACGTGGDVFDFLQAYGKTPKEAAELLGGATEGQLMAAGQKRTSKKPPPRVTWRQVLPPSAPDALSHYRHGQPSRTWSYRNQAGELIGYVCRFDTPEGKEVLPYIYATDGTRSEWRWQGFDKPRPLYRLDVLTANPSKTVIVVEGEKTADALAQLVEQFGKSVVTCWQGGAGAINQTDWTPLHGRRVLFWPDNDYSHHYGTKHEKAGQLKPFEEQPGNKAMLEIAQLAKATVTKFIKNPDGKPCGWDIADDNWEPEATRKYILANAFDQLRPVSDYLNLANPNPDPEPGPPEGPEQPPPFSGPALFIEEGVQPPGPAVPPDFQQMPGDDDGGPDDGPGLENPHFRFLGYINDGGRPVHCFYPMANKIIVKLNTSQITKSSLIDLAPLSFWEHNFPSKRGVNVEAATNWLANTSQSFGIFSDKLIRGRGAWHDAGRTIVHAGSQLIVDGAATPLGKIDTRYIYEVGEPLGFSTAAPLRATEAVKLMEVLNLLNWDREINSYLLAGWCVVAPICGALKWRPHIWLTGAAGTGKSWVFKNIVRRLLGETALAVQGETSEAGVRQSLGHDALPVVFDEAEAEDKRSQERIQTILTLMRSASAEDGGVMAKGSAGGSAVTFRTRSCFAFASISVSLSQQSDRTRVTLLGLSKLKDQAMRQERWEQLLGLYHKIITPEYVEGLQARTLQLVPTIIRNASTFANAAAAVIGEQRTGDQLGALLAGAYSLHSNKVIGYEEAVEWVKGKDWSEERGLEASRDEHALFSFLMEQITKVDGIGTTVERQVGELVLIAAQHQYDSLVTEDVARARLRRLGIKLDADHILISNSADSLKKMLANTPWAKNHNKILMRLEGAKEHESTKFASGVQTRAVAVPLSLLNR